MIKKLYSLLLIIFVSFSSYSQTPLANTTVTGFVSNVTLTGFTLQFDTPVVGLTVDDIDIYHCAVILSAVPGASTRSAQVRSIDNKTYIITTSPLTNNTTYGVVLRKANYSLSSPITFTTNISTLVNATVINATVGGFNMSFDKPVPGFGFSDITINNGASISSINTPDGQNYNVNTTALTTGSTYSVSLRKSEYSFYGNTTFLLKTPPPISVIGTITNVIVNGFSIVFDRAVAGLAASDVTLTGGATVASLTAVGSDNKKYTIATSALTAGTVYNVAIAKTGYSFIEALSFTAIPEAVIATISNTSSTGFTLSFDKAVDGLTASNLSINNGATVSAITPSAGNTVYAVTTNTLAAGGTYSLTLTKAGYAFNNPIAFTVTVPPSTAKAITAFSFAGLTPAVNGVINETAKTVALSVPSGTNVTALVATFTHTGASLKIGSTVQTSGTTANNFTSPVTYTVTAEDGTTQNYVVTVTILPSTAKVLTAFSFAGLSPAVTGVINEAAKTVELTVPSGTNVTALVATFTHTGASVKVGSTVQTSGTTANNFTSPVTYTVTAEDATTQNYVVTVNGLTSIVASITNPTTLGFTLTFDKAVVGLAKENITLAPAATITSVTAVGTENKVFTVVTSALTVGTTYTVAITKTGYTFSGTLTFVAAKSTLADLTSLKLGAEGYAIAIPAAEGTTTLANAPRTIQAAAATLKAVAAISPGATMSPADLSSVDFGTGKTVTITVTAEDGTTVKNYKFIITAYDATSNPYGIYNPLHLSDMRNGVEATDSYKLMNDVTLPAMAGYNDTTDPEGMRIKDYSTAGWDPIWSGTKNFSGSLDGNAKTVSGLSINRSTTNYVGLFRATESPSVIKNIGVIIVGSVNGNNYVGGLVGYIAGGTVITYCYTKGSVSGANNIGGLIGYNKGTVTNCYSTATVEGWGAYNGGFAGWNQYGNISNCYASGAVNGSDVVGGFLGGALYEASIKNCYATGLVKSLAASSGLIAFLSANPINVLNYYWDITSTKQTMSFNGNGIGKTTAEMQTATPYDATWTAANWTFTAGQYPKLVGVGGQN